MLLRLFLLLSPLAILAQGDLIAEWQKQYDTWYWRSPRTKVDAPQWSRDGNTLAYAWTDPAEISWRLVDCGTGKTRPAFDPAKLSAAFTSFDGRKVTAKKWPFTRIIPMDDGRLRLENDKESWFLGTDGKIVIAAGPSAARPPGRPNSGSRTLNAGKEGSVSPDSRTRVELREGGVYLTTAAGHTPSWAPSGRETFVGPISWSPDGRHFAVWREIKETTRLYNVVDSVKGTSREIPYDKPGDPRTTRTPWVFQADGKGASGCPLNVLPQAYATDRLDWSADSKVLRTEYIRRGFTGHGIVAYDVEKGAWRKVLAEEDPKFVYTFNARYRHDLSDDLTLWASERSGWNHLYAVDLRTGQTLRPLTSGEWVVKQVTHLDAEAKEIYFQAVGRVAGENPYHTHLCKVGLDGKGLVDLTPDDAYHDVSFSPDRRTFIDTASRVDVPHAFFLRSAKDGKILATLGVSDVSDLRKAGWQPARPFVAKDREGKFDIWGVVTRPYPFDPKKKYPVIENIYAGPHGSFAPRTFNWWHRNHRELSMLGFYVVQLDGRGTNHRGKEFHQQIWRNLKDGGFPDRIAWMQALAKTEPNMDLSRVGIFGGSAGGQNTAHALLLHGGFYKAGAADCGCYDNRVDKLWWNEQWLGYPVGPWYEENSCAKYAANLSGRLFLSVGESDTNVDVKCSYDFRDALIAAGKRDQFEFHVVPGANHGAGESNDMRVKRARFFQSALGQPLPL
ncbi:MAG: Prolyl tripeptidyl peptidase precursor [Verrucomicrobiota bacterium]|jgi:dipeptidyl aminopeptidase/acylaminoacyl peptidase